MQSKHQNKIIELLQYALTITGFATRRMMAAAGVEARQNKGKHPKVSDFK